MRFRPDPFIVALVATALLAGFVPAQGEWLDGFKVAAKVAIALLFFLYGARLSTSEAVAGLKRWRLHVAILGTTFIVFPLFGLVAHLLQHSILTPGLAAGVLLLCLIPSTVQSSVAFTGIAGGNVAGAVVSASMSNLLGVVLTPLLVALLLSETSAQVDGGSVLRIVALLLAPFVVGQLVRPWIGAWMERHDHQLRRYDRSSILLVVYVAFSEGTNADVWSRLDGWSLVGLVAVCLALLIAVAAFCLTLGRAWDFPRGDRIALLFCGTQKSLASGLPMASVMFTGDELALIILPLMVFHQMQLIASALVASRLKNSN